MSLLNKLFSGVTVAAAVFAFSTITMAQDGSGTAPAKEKAEKRVRAEGRGYHKGHGEGFGHKRGGMMRMLHGLNLTDAQKTQIKSIMDANKPDQTVRDEMKSLYEAKRNGTITAEQQARIDSLKEQAKANKQARRQQIEAILTPEQKAQLEQKKQEMKLRRQERQNAPAATTETTNED